ncbi:MAG: amidase family protein, partial [Dehalococcoidia bacterium]
ARRTQQDKDRSRFEPVTWAMAERGWRMTAADHLLAVQDMQQVSRDVAHFFNAVDVWLTPTLGTPPLPFQSFERSHDNRRELAESTLRSIEFTRIANVTGQPAMSVPLYWNVQGLPIGVHFSARFGDEATLFRLAAQLEEARPWVNKRPPIYA